MDNLSLLQMLWFPVVAVTVVLLWMVLVIRGAIRRRRLDRMRPNIVVRLPDDSNIVRNDGHNLDN